MFDLDRRKVVSPTGWTALPEFLNLGEYLRVLQHCCSYFSYHCDKISDLQSLKEARLTFGSQCAQVSVPRQLAPGQNGMKQGPGAESCSWWTGNRGYTPCRPPLVPCLFSPVTSEAGEAGGLSGSKP